MTKETWIKHMESVSGLIRPSISGDKINWLTAQRIHCPSCAICKDRQRTRKANARAKAIHEAYTSCGLKRVKGSLGGVYYE